MSTQPAAWRARTRNTMRNRNAFHSLPSHTLNWLSSHEPSILPLASFTLFHSGHLVFWLWTWALEGRQG